MLIICGDMLYPSFITAILERASGTETPAATNVRPITVSGIPKVVPEKRIPTVNYSTSMYIFITKL